MIDRRSVDHCSNECCHASGMAETYITRSEQVLVTFTVGRVHAGPLVVTSVSQLSVLFFGSIMLMRIRRVDYYKV